MNKFSLLDFLYPAKLYFRNPRVKNRQKGKWKTPVPLKPRPGTGTVLFLLHAIDQRKSQGQPRF